MQQKNTDHQVVCKNTQREKNELYRYSDLNKENATLEKYTKY